MAERKTTTLEFVMTTKNGKAFMNWLQSEAAKSSEKMTKLKTDIEGVLQKVKEKDPSIKNKTGLLSYQGADKQILAWKKEVLDLDNTLKQTTADLKMFEQAKNGIQRQESMFSKAMDGISGMNLKQLRQAAAEYKTMLGNIGKAEKAEHDNAWLKERREIFAAINARIKELEQGMLNARNEAEKFLQTSEKERSETAAQVQQHKENLRVLREENAEQERLVSESKRKEVDAIATQKQLASQVEGMTTKRKESMEQIEANNTKINTLDGEISTLETNITNNKAEQAKHQATILELAKKGKEEELDTEKIHKRWTQQQKAMTEARGKIERKMGTAAARLFGKDGAALTSDYAADLKGYQEASSLSQDIHTFKQNQRATTTSKKTDETTKELADRLQQEKIALGEARAVVEKHTQEVADLQRKGTQKLKATPKVWQEMIAKLQDPFTAFGVTEQMKATFVSSDKELADGIERVSKNLARRMQNIFESKEWKDDKGGKLVKALQPEFEAAFEYVQKQMQAIAELMTSGKYGTGYTGEDGKKYTVQAFRELKNMQSAQAGDKGKEQKFGFNRMDKALADSGIKPTPMLTTSQSQENVNAAQQYIIANEKRIESDEKMLEERTRFNQQFSQRLSQFVGDSKKYDQEFVNAFNQEMQRFLALEEEMGPKMKAVLADITTTTTNEVNKFKATGVTKWKKGNQAFTEREIQQLTTWFKQYTEAFQTAGVAEQEYTEQQEKSLKTANKKNKQLEKSIEKDKEASKAKQDEVTSLKKWNEATEQGIPKEEDIAKAQEKSALAAKDATEATRQRKEIEEKAQAIFDKNAEKIEKEVQGLLKLDTIEIKTAEDMQHYISVLKQNANALDQTSTAYADSQRLIEKMEIEYSRFTNKIGEATEYTNANKDAMEILGKKSLPELQVLRKHFEMVAGSVHLTKEKVDEAKLALVNINKEIVTKTAQSKVNPAMQQLSSAKSMKRLSDGEIAQNVKDLYQYADAAKLSTTERKKLNEAIARGEAHMRQVSNGDNLARMTAQYKYLTKSQQNMSQMSDDAMRKQQQFWLQQSTLVGNGTEKETDYLAKYRKVTEAILERQQRQRAAMAETRQKENEMRAEEILAKGISKVEQEELEIVKRIYQQKVMIGQTANGERDTLIAILKDEERRLTLQKQIAAESHNMTLADAKSILRNPLAHTALEVEQATKFAKDYLLVNKQNDEESKKLAKSLERCTEEQKKFNEESKRSVMAGKLADITKLGNGALKEQIEYWKKIEKETEGATARATEYNNAVANRKAAQAQLQANLMDKVGISTMGGAAIQSVAQSNGAATLLQQIKQGSIGSLDKMKEVEAELKVLRGLVDESKAPGAIRLIDEGLAKLKLDMTQLDQNLMSIADAEQRVAELGKSGASTTALEVEKLKAALEAGLKYYKEMGDAAGVTRMKKALADLTVSADRLGVSTKAIGQAAKASTVDEETLAKLMKDPSKEMSLKKLKDAYNSLKQSIDNAVDTQKRYNEVAGGMRNIDAQIQRIQKNVHASENGLTKFLQGVKQYAMFYFGTMAIMMRIQNVVTKNKEMSDSIANVAKVANATTAEVNNLVTNIQKIDTRTATSELMKMAEQAAKLGIYTRAGAEGVEEFVRAADKITKTLGEDIGGAEAVADLVKLNDLINGEGGSLNTSLNKLGSAILAVGNNSAASYGHVVEFLRQTGAAGSVVKLSVQQLTALGATFSSLGAKMDQSATSINKMMVGIQKNTFAVAKSVGLSAVEMQKQLAAGDSFGVFVDVLDRIKDLQDAGENVSSVIGNVLKAMGGRQNAQMVTAMSLLVQNTARLREELGYASEAYEEGTLMTKEYMRVQNTLAGQMDKVGKAFTDTFTNPAVVAGLQGLIHMIGSFMSALLSLPGLLVMCTMYLGKLIVGFRTLYAEMQASMIGVNSFKAILSGFVFAMTGIITFIPKFIIALRGVTMSFGGIQLAAGLASKSIVMGFRAMWAGIKAIPFIGWVMTIIGALALLKDKLFELNDDQLTSKAFASAGRAAEVAGAKMRRCADDMETQYNAMKKLEDEYNELHNKTGKTIEQLNEMIDKNEQLTKDESDQVKKKEELTEQTAKYNTALSLFNKQYSQYLGFQLTDLENTNLLIHAKEKLAAALQKEAYERGLEDRKEAIIQKYEEDLDTDSNDFMTDLNDMNRRNALSFGKSEKYVDVNDMHTEILKVAAEMVDKAIKEGKTKWDDSIAKNVADKLDKEFADVVLKDFWHEKWSDFDSNLTNVEEYTEELFNQNMAFVQAEKTFSAQIQQSNESIADSDRKITEDRKKELEGYIQQLQSGSKSIDDLMKSTKGNVLKLFKDIVKQQEQIYIQSAGNVTEAFRNQLKLYQDFMGQFEEYNRKMLRESVWGADSKDLNSMGAEQIKKTHDTLNSASQLIKDGTNIAEIANAIAPIDETGSPMAKFRDALIEATTRAKSEGKSDSEIAELQRSMIDEQDELVKARAEAIHVNLSGNLQHPSDGNKDKWKQEAKDQYNAYIKELDDYYVRMQMQEDRLRALGQISQEEYEKRKEYTDKEHEDNRSRLRNMFVKDYKGLYDETIGELTEEFIKKIYGKGNEAFNIDNWFNAKDGFKHTRALIQKLGDAFLDEIKLKSDEDQLKILQTWRKHQDEFEKAVLEGDPLKKVVNDFRNTANSLKMIFGEADFLKQIKDGTEHTEEEYQRRLDIFQAYAERITTMTFEEFQAEISATAEFAGRTEEEYQLMYQKLLQYRDDYDEAARKQAKQSLKLLTNRVESGEYYAQQLASLRKYQEELVKAGKTGTEAYLSVARAIEVVGKKQNMLVEGKQMTYQQRMKQMLESANRRVKMEEGVKNSGVNNGVQLGQAKLRVATTDFAMAMEEYQIRREEANRIILDVLKQIEDAKAAIDALEEGTEEHEKARIKFEALGLELKKAKVQESEIMADTYDKMLEKQRAVAEQEAEIQAERINSVQEFAESFRDVIERVSMADITARDAKAFELSKLRYEKELGLVQDFTRQRYLIIRKDGENYQKWMTQEEAILFQQQIDAQNQRREALSEGLKNFGEKIGKQLRDAMNRQMELRDEERKERDRQKVIQNVQAEALAFQRNAEHNQTLFLKSELDSRLEYWEEYFRKINSMGAEGTITTSDGVQLSTGVKAGEMQKFATGGFIRGAVHERNGDGVVVRVNAGEAVLTPEQQRAFMALANGQVDISDKSVVKMMKELKVDMMDMMQYVKDFKSGYMQMTTLMPEMVVSGSPVSDESWAPYDVRKYIYDHHTPSGYALRIDELVGNKKRRMVGALREAEWAIYMGIKPEDARVNPWDYLENATYEPSQGRSKGRLYKIKDNVQGDHISLFGADILDDSTLFEILNSERKNIIKSGKTLGDFTIGFGEDNTGLYISYYDEWDNAPITDNMARSAKRARRKSKSNNASYFTKILNELYAKALETITPVETDDTLGIGTPFSVYDRRYFTREELARLMYNRSEDFGSNKMLLKKIFGITNQEGFDDLINSERLKSQIEHYEDGLKIMTDESWKSTVEDYQDRIKSLKSELAKLPKFAGGGIADGPTSGDQKVIRVNGREMILTLEQQKRLLDIANGKYQPGSQQAESIRLELNIEAQELIDSLDDIFDQLSPIASMMELVVKPEAKPQPKNVATMQAEAVAMVDEKEWGRLWQSALSNVNIDSVIFDAISSSTKKGAFGPLTDKEAWKSIGISLGMNMATAASGVLTEKLGEWLNKKVIPNWGEHALGSERKATGKLMDEQLKLKAKEATVARKRTEKEFGDGSDEAKQAELAEAYAETYRELHRKAMDKLIKEANDAQDAMKKAVDTDEYSARRTEYMQKANAQVDEQQVADQTMSALNDKYGERSGYNEYHARRVAEVNAQGRVSVEGWQSMLGENGNGSLATDLMGQDMTLGSQLTGDAEMQKIAAYVEAWKAAYAEIGEAANKRVSDALASDQTLTAEAKQAVQTQTKDAKAAFGQQQKAGEAKEKGLQVASMATAAVSSGVQDMVTQASGNAMLGQMAGTISQVAGNVIAGIASGSAKTMGEMGWWGAAFIPLIQGTLMALLGLATSKMKKAQTEVAQATNVSAGRLTTGMLTYATGRYLDDEELKKGRITAGMMTMSDGYHPGQSYDVDGADGNSYSAKYEGAIKGTGIRKGTHFGIFSEVKPEMVIDGDTTALMHSKYPMLENAILQLHRTGSLNMGEMLGLNYAGISKTIDTLYGSGRLSFTGGMRMPTFASGRYLTPSSLPLDVEGGMETGGAFAGAVDMQADIESRDRLAAAIEALVQNGVSAHMSSREASKSLAKQQRFEKRNGIKNGLYGAK